MAPVFKPSTESNDDITTTTAQEVAVTIAGMTDDDGSGEVTESVTDLSDGILTSQFTRRFNLDISTTTTHAETTAAGHDVITVRAAAG